MKTVATILLVVSLVMAVAEANEGTVVEFSAALEQGAVNLKPGVEFYVDLDGYDAPPEAELVILHTQDSPLPHYYFTELVRGKTLYKFSVETLDMSTGSPPFSGLEAGDSAFLIIGSETQPDSINMGVVRDYDSISIRVAD